MRGNPETAASDGTAQGHMARYNLVKIHGSLRVTPAMEAGVTPRV